MTMTNAPAANYHRTCCADAFLPAAFKYAMHAALFTLPVGLLLMSLMRYSSLLTLYSVASPEFWLRRGAAVFLWYCYYCTGFFLPL